MDWFKDPWNRADVFMLTIDLVGYILVNIPSKGNTLLYFNLFGYTGLPQSDMH